MSSLSSGQRTGSTGPEIVVLTVLGLLGTSLLMPALQQAQVDAKQVACANKLGKLGTAVANFEQTRRHLPAAWYHPGDSMASTAYGGAFTQLLPFIGQEELYRQYDWSKDWWHEANQPAVKTRVAAYECPAWESDHVVQGLRSIGGSDINKDLSAAIGDYWVLRGYIEDRSPRVDTRVPGAMMPLSDDGVQQQAHELLPRYELISDGRAQSLMISEKSGLPHLYVLGKKHEGESSQVNFNGPWVSYSSAWVRAFSADGLKDNWTSGPCLVNCQNGYAGIYSFHPGGANALFADGAVTLLSDKLSVDVGLALLSRSGGELLTAEDLQPAAAHKAAVDKPVSADKQAAK